MVQKRVLSILKLRKMFHWCNLPIFIYKKKHFLSKVMKNPQKNSIFVEVFMNSR